VAIKSTHSTTTRLAGASAAAVSALVVLAAQVALAAPSGWLAVDGRIRFNSGGSATYDWANSGAATPTHTCPAGAVNLSGSGGVFNCGIPGAGSNTPTAPTLTPTAAADPSIISAVFVADPITTDSNPCGGTGDSTLIAGGSKNGDTFTSITTTNGAILAKDDLSNVYAVSHTRADTGHPELFFAAERLDNNGDSHMDFEFLQSQIGVTAPCSGTFTGHRTEGDLLVAVDFTGGGVTAGTSVYQWHCAAEPGPQPADGTVCDPTGVQHYQLIPTPAFLTFTVNSVDVPCGGWVCREGPSGNSPTVSARNFLEGGIDLAGIPFAGCFNSFLPHTRTAQSFTSDLKDFAGPVSFHSCRNPAITTTSSPSGSTVAPGASAGDSVNVGNGGAGPVPTGTVTFFLCAPAQATAGGCPSGGTQVGAAKTLVSGAATSDPTTATTTLGTYCWRTVYAPGATSTGIYTGSTHTNGTTECFGVADAVAPAPGLPNTGVPAGLGADPVHLGGLLAGAALTLAIALRRTRRAAVLVLAMVAVTSSPPATSGYSLRVDPQLALPTMATLPAATDGTKMQAHPGWRLVIPTIGVDAVIQPVGLDRTQAMSVPADLTTVGWYDRGPLPGQPGDAVIDGHVGLAWEPAVFRDLHRLRPGDRFEVFWPGGRNLQFRVESSVRAAAAGPAPPGLFSRGGPSRLSLITCVGAWEPGGAAYSQRLIVTAVIASAA
jgi:sortase family protein